MTAGVKLANKEQADLTRREERHEYYQPAVDIRETSDEVILKYDMPGVGKDNVEITAERNTLTVTGNVDREDLGEAVYRETRIGNYRREFTLSDDVDPDSITAEMKAGVLTVKVSKPEKVKPKKIEITSE